MKRYLLSCLLLVFLDIGFGLKALSQSGDTVIYEAAEHLPMPLVPGCLPTQHPDWPEDSLRRCAELGLITLMRRNIRYPLEARQANIEGTVVLSFVVEVDGRISNIRIIKDIGGGCGAEAVRVLTELSQGGLRWKPAQQGGKPVRMRQALPLRFRLEEAPPFYLNERGDSIYTVIDTLPRFQGAGEDSLITFLLRELRYPRSYRDSCKVGVIETAILVHANGNIEIDNQLDFSNLGMDFQWEAIRLIHRTAGLWTPAYYQGRRVTTSVPLRVLFKSDALHCKAANDAFDQAMLLAADAADEEDLNVALEKWTQAVNLQPNNTELLYYRGSTLLNLNRREEACQDFARIRQLLGITWFESLRRVVCGW
ncbi:MAG: energy transducer TonB [Saprospiraceae bacterium]|nr:energy transducer TonB [Saprospiraceae bacterium]MDW8484196.1 energy transducer TonB [Saprospiraceae bacterium]